MHCRARSEISEDIGRIAGNGADVVGCPGDRPPKAVRRRAERVPRDPCRREGRIGGGGGRGMPRARGTRGTACRLRSRARGVRGRGGSGFSTGRAAFGCRGQPCQPAMRSEALSAAAYLAAGWVPSWVGSVCVPSRRAVCSALLLACDAPRCRGRDRDRDVLLHDRAVVARAVDPDRDDHVLRLVLSRSSARVGRLARRGALISALLTASPASSGALAGRGAVRATCRSDARVDLRDRAIVARAVDPDRDDDVLGLLLNCRCGCVCRLLVKAV